MERLNEADPYDLAETDHVDPDLQNTVIRTSTLTGNSQRSYQMLIQLDQV